MRLLPLLIGTLLAGIVVGCSSSSDGIGSGEADLTLRAFEYTCTSSSARILENAQSMKVTVTDGRLQFVDGYGPNLGERDRSYRAPRGTDRGRYVGFEYGGDCSLKVVIDTPGIQGAESFKMRVQCSADEEFEQDVYSCAGPRRASLNIPEPPITPTPDPTPSPAAKKWTCTTSDGQVLASTITVTVDDGAMRIVSEDLQYDGARDRAYRSRSGAYMQFDSFGYGGDCSMSVVVEEKVLSEPTPGSATLKVRCAGDDFTQNVYRCAPAP